jgi:hypothetical protein
MSICVLASILHQLKLFLSSRIFVLRAQKTMGNIFEHCPTKQDWFLLHKTNLGAKVSEVEVNDFSAVQRDCA